MIRFNKCLASIIIIQISGFSCSSQKTDLGFQPGAYQVLQYVPLVKEKNVGIVANHASYINHTHLLDTLLSLNIHVTKVFTPEHGLWGNMDAGETVENQESVAKNVEVVSLYGSGYKPSKESLQEIEFIIFDLQDVGVRFYTYISTLHYVMEACAENNITLIVLDRPNPNAHIIDGPILEKEFESFVGMHPVPVSYGMTIGEYAQMINGEGWLSDSLKCDLRVIPCKNYTHLTKVDLPIAPSPNLSDMKSIYLYPSLCFFEGTIMSEGRGTPYPFKVIGHPKYPDTTFSFKPVSIPGKSKNPKFKDEVCYGLDFRDVSIDSLITRNTLDLSPLITCYQKMKIGRYFFNVYFKNLAGTESLQKAIIQGKTEEEIRHEWKPALDSFKLVREKYLLYE